MSFSILYISHYSSQHSIIYTPLVTETVSEDCEFIQYEWIYCLRTWETFRDRRDNRDQVEHGVRDDHQQSLMIGWISLQSTLSVWDYSIRLTSTQLEFDSSKYFPK